MKMKHSLRYFSQSLFVLLCVKCLFCLQNDEVLPDVYCELNIEGDVLCNDFSKEDRYIFYDVNPPEGFNLRRDVYLRLAIFTHDIIKIKKYQNIKLVLPPWNDLYHWRSKDIGFQSQIPWSLFFDIQSLKKFAPVVELHEVFTKDKFLTLDRVYMLHHFPDAFDSGDFKEKFEVQEAKTCQPESEFWGYTNISFKTHECIHFQGGAAQLRHIIDFHQGDKKLMFTNAEVVLHDEYGTKKYWDARKSMKFSIDLIDIAEHFIEKELNCFSPICDTYIGVHWRRGDFAKSRRKEVPSVENTAKQIFEIISNQYQSLITTVFIATDADEDQLEDLAFLLESKGLVVKWFSPTRDVIITYKDGGMAIIDQIICSHAAYFVGTHESTFTFRIQEEREILGFDSETTFNRFCPDSGPCERMSRWKIVN